MAIARFFRLRIAMLRRRQVLRGQLRSLIELATEAPVRKRITIRLNGQSSPGIKICARVAGGGEPIPPAFFGRAIRRLPDRHRRLAVAHSTVVKHAPQIGRHTDQELVSRSPGFDPCIHVAHAPIVRGDCIPPVLVPPEQQRQVFSSDGAILDQIKSIPPADICRRRFGHLHWSLRPRRIGPPHTKILAMAGLRAINSIGHPIKRHPRARSLVLDRSLTWTSCRAHRDHRVPRRGALPGLRHRSLLDNQDRDQYESDATPHCSPLLAYGKNSAEKHAGKGRICRECAEKSLISVNQYFVTISWQFGCELFLHGRSSSPGLPDRYNGLTAPRRARWRPCRRRRTWLRRPSVRRAVCPRSAHVRPCAPPTSHRGDRSRSRRRRPCTGRDRWRAGCGNREPVRRRLH